jgi:hypothetical protein
MRTIVCTIAVAAVSAVFTVLLALPALADPTGPLMHFHG